MLVKKSKWRARSKINNWSGEQGIEKAKTAWERKDDWLEKKKADINLLQKKNSTLYRILSFVISIACVTLWWEHSKKEITEIF